MIEMATTTKTKKSPWSMCHGAVRTKAASKKEHTFDLTAKDYESAIRQIKRHAESNYRDSHHECTLFYNGNIVGWAFRMDGKMIYVAKDTLQYIGILPRTKN